jgi:NADH-quinone oxidoreductase subunit M
MILIWLIVIPLVAGIVAWLAGRSNANWPRWIALLALGANLAIAALVWAQGAGAAPATQAPVWYASVDLEWIPQLGIGFRLAMDGLSILFVALTSFIGILAVIGSWREVRERVGFFHFNLLWVLAGITGVFLAVDLFLFAFFWEVMLVPMYFLYVWGYGRRTQAAIKFFIFTQISGLLMIVAIIGLYFVHGQATGTFTFAYSELLGTAIPANLALPLMLGFFIAFAVKIGAVPFHSWLPDAYVEAPTAGTVILSGLMAKTAGYALLRFVVPLFPDAALAFAPVGMALGVASILYGALLAFSQTDLKRIVAYSSISHMGFVLLGVFAWTELAWQGAVIVMLAHGFSTSALFLMIGLLQERVGTREIERFGGLWSTAPRLSGAFLLFALAALGLPGLGNFVGEFLVLIGTYPASVLAAALGAIGIVLATVYALRLFGRSFHGPNTESWQLPDFSPREALVAGALIVAIVWLGSSRNR